MKAKKVNERVPKYTALQACLLTTLTAMRIWKRMLVVTTTIWKVPSTFLFLSVFLFAYAAVVFETEAFMEFAHARRILTLPPANCTHKHENVISRGRILLSCLILETGGKRRQGDARGLGFSTPPRRGTWIPHTQGLGVLFQNAGLLERNGTAQGPSEQLLVTWLSAPPFMASLGHCL